MKRSAAQTQVMWRERRAVPTEWVAKKTGYHVMTIIGFATTKRVTAYQPGGKGSHRYVSYDGMRKLLSENAWMLDLTMEDLAYLGATEEERKAATKALPKPPPGAGARMFNPAAR